MKIKTLFKTLPVIAVLALGLTLAPTLSYADNDDRGRHKNQYSHDKGKSHYKNHGKSDRRDDSHGGKYKFKEHRKERHNAYRDDKRGHNKHSSKHHRGKKHGLHKQHAYNKHGHHKHGHRVHSHRNHDHRGHSHTSYIVNDYNYYDHYDRYLNLDDLRFSLGLHTRNFDILLRD